jgi:hypothetical protein
MVFTCRKTGFQMTNASPPLLLPLKGRIKEGMGLRSKNDKIGFGEKAKTVIL